jgi:hypothetical protein
MQSWKRFREVYPHLLLVPRALEEPFASIFGPFACESNQPDIFAFGTNYEWKSILQIYGIWIRTDNCRGC